MSIHLKRTVLALSGLLAALVLTEGALRLLGFGVLTPEMSFGMHARTALEQGVLVPDPHLFWRMQPGLNPRFERIANIVHPDRPVPPRKDRSRILILGDSCSRVAGSDYPYSVYLQRLLGREHWEVLNASVPGYTSHQGRRWLDLQLLETEPDVAVIYFGWNDHWRTTGRTDREYEASRRWWYPRILTLLRGRPEVAPFRVPLSDYRDNLEWMVAQLTARGSRVLLVLAPYRFTEEGRRRYVQDHYLVPGDDPEAIHREYLDVVRGFAGREGVALLGADSLFTGHGETPPLLRQDGIHFTGTGHRVLAALLEEMLRTGAGADGSPALELMRRTWTPPPGPD